MKLDFTSTNLNIKDQISVLQRMIIIHSILYYELNDSIISDKSYDELSKQLVEMQRNNITNDSDYYYCMSDFDGTTGFDLYSRLTEKDKDYLKKIAFNLLKNSNYKQIGRR